jgi:metal-responsive CopG/Arc/MetJ family transcriptional regulator
MQKTAAGFERMTISLPIDFVRDIEILKEELHVPKSEVMRMAVEKFLKDYRRQNIRKIAEMMAEDYRADTDLTVLTALDSEDFR